MRVFWSTSTTVAVVVTIEDAEFGPADCDTVVDGAVAAFSCVAHPSARTVHTPTMRLFIASPLSRSAAHQHELLRRRVSGARERLADRPVAVEVDLPVVLVPARRPHCEERSRGGELQDIRLGGRVGRDV